jgi:phosphatidylinositol kinase/protein kinase (PI-3  family)
LNEECGLLEWVSNTNALKNILEEVYQRHGKKIWVSTTGVQCTDSQPPDLSGKLEQARKSGTEAQVAHFKDHVLKL